MNYYDGQEDLDQEQSSTRIGIFTIKDGNTWLEQSKDKPTPRDLYDKLWFENEVCIMFADTNLGKSILAVQIGCSISEQQKVIYFDFEMTEKQFESRYRDSTTAHNFPANFLRAAPDISQDVYALRALSLEEYINDCIERVVKTTNSKIIIIDNLTYLRSEMEKSKEALPLMKHLKLLQNKYGLSIFCLAHTPKRNMSKPITTNDLAGSKMLINFCDSAFAIGQSMKDSSLRYVKHIKARNTSKDQPGYDIKLFRIVKDKSFLQFEFVSNGFERDHLLETSENIRQERRNKALELREQGYPNTKIAEELGVTEGAVRRWAKKNQTQDE